MEIGILLHGGHWWRQRIMAACILETSRQTASVVYLTFEPTSCAHGLLQTASTSDVDPIDHVDATGNCACEALATFAGGGRNRGMYVWCFALVTPPGQSKFPTHLTTATARTIIRQSASHGVSGYLHIPAMPNDRYPGVALLDL